jgi:hypothetical protein
MAEGFSPRLHARRGVELAPSIASNHRRLADALDALGENALAIASCRRAVELDESEPPAARQSARSRALHDSAAEPNNDEQLAAQVPGELRICR